MKWKTIYTEETEVEENSTIIDADVKAKFNEVRTWSKIRMKMNKLRRGFDEKTESWWTIPKRKIKRRGFDIGEDETTDGYECVLSFFMKTEYGHLFLKELAQDALDYLEDETGKEYELLSILKAALRFGPHHYYITFSARQKTIKDIDDVVKTIQSIHYSSMACGNEVIFMRFQPAPDPRLPKPARHRGRNHRLAK